MSTSRRKCRFCGKEFIVIEMVFPIMDDHNGEGVTIICPHCLKQVEYVANRSTRDYMSYTIEDYEAKQKASVDYEKSKPICPICGKKMTQRLRHSDNKPFWGCPDYPKCKGTRNIQ